MENELTDMEFIKTNKEILGENSLKELLLSKIKEIDVKYIFDLSEEELINMALFSLLETYKDNDSSETDNLADMKVFLMASAIGYGKKNNL